MPQLSGERRRVVYLMIVCALGLLAVVIPARARARIYFANYRADGGNGTAALDGSELNLHLAGEPRRLV